MAKILKIGDIVKSPLHFKLIEKDYKTEIYTTKTLEWNNVPIILQVRMWYHTFLHYWDVAYTVLYGKYYIVNIKAEGDLKRKEARYIALKYMKEANINDIYMLNDFYQNAILNSK